MTSQRGITVYDERGRLRFGAAARLWSAPAWSPSGRWVAAVVGRTLQVRTATGALVLRKTLPDLGSLSVGREFGITWAGEGRVAISRVGREANQFRGVRVPSGKTWRPLSRWFQPRSADGKLAILTPPSGQDFALGVAPAAGGVVRSYAGVAGCYDRSVWIPAVQSLQFVGRGRSILYASYCLEPFSHLYSVAPDGNGLRQITSGRSYETDPVLSPDGGEIAYSWAQYTGLSCLGCPSQIRVANADGGGVRTVTNPPTGSLDLWPTWSPDGKTILFTRASATSPDQLFTVPAAGGPAHDLGIQGSQPAWGPSRIAYVQDGIWTADPDGGNPEEVTTAPYARHPFWSQDGTLAYTNFYGTQVFFGSNTPVLYPFHLVTSIAWSPDNTHFLVTARTVRADGPLDIYTIRTDGTTDLARLTRNYNATSATWR